MTNTDKINKIESLKEKMKEIEDLEYIKENLNNTHCYNYKDIVDYEEATKLIINLLNEKKIEFQTILLDLGLNKFERFEKKEFKRKILKF